ncbi:MAG TPA: endonuclease/exonuclease/phosphatase family protein [Polyangia bacterium]|jgi:endonuclease/exonuclease/phosphatase (EEP) superfamily protein YafD
MHRILAALLGLTLVAACARPTRTPATPPPGTPVLTVMTYNVNFGLAGDDSCIAAIRAAGPDLVLLQETTPAWEDALRRELGGTYPFAAFRHAGGAGGLGVLSRHPFDERAYLPSPAGWFPAWLLVVRTPLGPLQVLNVHLRPPVSDGGSVVSGYFSTRPVRQAEIAAYADRLDPGLPTLVAGDFNESRTGRAVGLLATRGLRSALPDFAPGAQTWRWPTSVGTVRSQLDHIVHDARLVPLDARVVDAGSSDHLPVVARFALAGAVVR